ncbi:hypothetical protein PtB15_15B160 [Puccinia triticina]|nr:hypothetical protein PtB15_15B160 [Puccinia triticina]
MAPTLPNPTNSQKGSTQPARKRKSAAEKHSQLTPNTTNSAAEKRQKPSTNEINRIDDNQNSPPNSSTPVATENPIGAQSGAAKRRPSKGREPLPLEKAIEETKIYRAQCIASKERRDRLKIEAENVRAKMAQGYDEGSSNIRKEADDSDDSDSE